MELPDEDLRRWPIKRIQIKDLRLDHENPRLALPNGATQQEIRNALFSQGKVLNLVESILENGGLFQGEDIIVIEENGQYRVLEGNRRVCAIQCIIDNSLCPDDFKKQLEELVDNKTIDPKMLDPIEARISPSWEAAQPTITARHSQYAIEKWSYLSKWRRDYLYFKQKGNVDVVAQIFDEGQRVVIENIKNFVLIDYIRRIRAFNAQEKEILNKNDLPVSQLIWHLSKDMRELLGIDYDSNFNLKVSIDEKKFEYIMERIARFAFLISPPKITTRVSREEIMNLVKQWGREYDEGQGGRGGNEEVKGGTSTGHDEPGKGSEESTKSREKSKKRSGGGKPEKYFASLHKDISINDQRLKRLTYELAKNDMKDRPASGILLARSLIESALIYRIDQKGLKSQMLKKHAKPVEDMKLSEILSFSINNVQKLFDDHKSAKKCLEKIQSEHREYMNSIVHGAWMDPNAGEVERIAGTTRELLRTILTDSP